MALPSDIRTQEPELAISQGVEVSVSKLEKLNIQHDNRNCLKIINSHYAYSLL